MLLPARRTGIVVAVAVVVVLAIVAAILARQLLTRDTSTAVAHRTDGRKIVGYFTQWGTYDPNYLVKNIDTSGSAATLTHINYAFGNVKNGRCTAEDDPTADYERSYTTRESVDGAADTADQPLRGTFNQLLKLKKRHPHLKVIWSFGGR